MWVRHRDDEIVIVHIDRAGAHEIARWQPTVPGQPRHDPAHFGPPPEGPLHRAPKARTPDEAAFLATGNGGRQSLISAAGVGTSRMRTKMIAAVALAKIYVRSRRWRPGFSGRIGGALPTRILLR